MEKEIRQLSNEIRVLEDSRKIEGYAAVFDSASRDMGFTEYIDRGAFDGVLERSDVFAVLNHQPDKVLARWNRGNGSLKLSVDERGLKYEFDAPHTDLGNSVLEFVKRGELTESSFAFVVEKDSWEKLDDGTYVRHIIQVNSLHDVSPCWTAAYASTSVSCRSFEEFKAQELAQEQEKREEPKVEDEPVDTPEPEVEEPKEEENREEPKNPEEEAKKEISEELAKYYSGLREENAKYLKK